MLCSTHFCGGSVMSRLFRRKLGRHHPPPYKPERWEIKVALVAVMWLIFAFIYLGVTT